eukprot:762973-Rhodomonas_salina.1
MGGRPGALSVRMLMRVGAERATGVRCCARQCLSPTPRPPTGTPHSLLPALPNHSGNPTPTRSMHVVAFVLAFKLAEHV